MRWRLLYQSDLTDSARANGSLGTDWNLAKSKRSKLEVFINKSKLRCLAIHVDQGSNGEQVVDVTDRLLFQRDEAPAKIMVGNGPELSLERSTSGSKSTCSHSISEGQGSQPPMHWGTLRVTAEAYYCWRDLKPRS